MIRAFDKFGVPQEAIEKRLGHKMDICTDDELAELVAIGNSIKDGISKRQDWFDIGGEAQSESAKDLTDKLKNERKQQTRVRQPGEDD
jgi:hypothetical protein